jgi:hypothetical protein
MDLLTLNLNKGLKYSATSTMCAQAITFLMAYDYDDNDIAQIARNLFNLRAGLSRLGT